MGLASKLAAGGAAYAVSNQAYDQYATSQGGHGGHGSGPAAGAAAAALVPGVYGAPHPQQQMPPPHQPQQSGPDNAALHNMLKQKLSTIIAANALQVFYPPTTLDAICTRLQSVDFRALAARYNLPVELALDLAVLALYDIVIYCDDSASMRFAEKGERIEDLKAIAERVATVATQFDADGISLRAMNSAAAADGVRDSAQAAAYIGQLTFNGGTPMGTAMEKHVLKPLLYKPIKAKALRKPLLVITITDGEPTGESRDKLLRVVKESKKDCKKSPWGEGCVAFQIAQVGRDQGAQAFLKQLDDDAKVGKMIDCTSYYELEQEECKRKGINLTPDLWMLKLMVGAVDRSYDNTD